MQCNIQMLRFLCNLKKMTAVLLILMLKPDGTVSADYSVLFENPDYCALKGSSVEFKCSYNYPSRESVKKTEWYKGVLKGARWIRQKLGPLQNRSEYVGDLQHKCNLAVHDLQDSDAGHYYFRFDTDALGRRSKGSVHLTVTEMKARIHPRTVGAGDNVTLDCQTSCQLSSTVWFKDGQRVRHATFQARAEDAGNYVCAVEGEESMQSDPVALDVQYPPLNVSVEVSPAGPSTAGGRVNLTCSSVANPAVEDYSWFQVGPSSVIHVGSGQVLSLSSVEESDGTRYICQAKNPRGGNNSTEVLLTVKDTDRVIFFTIIGIKVFIVLVLTLLIIWVWWKWRDPPADEEDHDYENVIT